MSQTVVFTAHARRDMKRMDRQMTARVVAALERLAETGQGDVQRLTDVFPPEYRLRVGDIRARYQLDDATATLTVLRVLPRGEAYR